MKALSIQQPWAYAIFHLGKDVENRTWPTHFRGRFQVHAGKKLDKEGVAWLRSKGFDVPDDLPRGYLGEVTIVGCVEPCDIVGPDDGENQWAFGPYCFLLDCPVEYPEPVPGLGQRGWYESGNAGSNIE